jgi:hypothetical protein
MLIQLGLVVQLKPPASSSPPAAMLLGAAGSVLSRTSQLSWLFSCR